MKFTEFERRAREMFASIPAEVRRGVEYVAVHCEARPHPDMPGIYTLGECATGELDLAGAAAGGVRSGVHLYHGSFRELAREDPDFDWEAELWETLTHEIRHHRESGAGEDALDDLDWAEDQNFRRREGKRFDPLFYRAGTPVAPGAWEVDGDLFVEREISPAELDFRDEITMTIDGGTVIVPLPGHLRDVHYLYLQREWGGDVAVVLVRPRSTWEQLRALFTSRPLDVQESRVEIERDAGSTGVDGPAASE